LSLLSELLDRLRDPPGEAIEDKRAYNQERDGNAHPELHEPAHLLLDSRERQTEPDTADRLHARLGVSRLCTGADQLLVRRLRLLCQDGRQELEEPLTRSLDDSREWTVRCHVSETSLDNDRAAAGGENSPVGPVDDDVGHVRALERSPHRGFQKLLVLAEGPELTRKAEVRRQGQPSLLEFLGHDPPVLADVHPALEHQERHHDRDDGPEDPSPEGREAAKSRA